MRNPSTAHPSDLFDTLQAWVEAGALRALDLAFTRFIADQGTEQDEAVLLATVLTSERQSQGHVCLDLEGALGDPNAVLVHPQEDQTIAAAITDALAARLETISLADWVARLAASPAVCDRLHQDQDDGASPLVLAGSPEQPLLYLRRYWRDEQIIRDGITRRLAADLPVDRDALRDQLDRLFVATDGRDEPSPNWQRIACALAARSAFFIITGGPGTGKTTTVVRLLALLQGLAIAADRPTLRIELAAPTGKAAARLNASIADQVKGLSGQLAPPESIPTQVKTLHRLLGSLPDSRHFRHHAANPLPADLIVVDEASMVDIEMMARLLDAMRPEARLILLGDKDQLSSVEAGAVLGDLCRRAARAHYRPETMAWLRDASGEEVAETLVDPEGTALDQSIVMLRTSYRFSAEGGIGALAACVNEASPGPLDATDRLHAVLTLFEENARHPREKLGVIQALRLPPGQDTALLDLIGERYAGEGSYLRLMREGAPEADADQATIDRWAARVLEAHKGFQVLSPLRLGTWGVDGLNQRIVEHLHQQGLLDPAPTSASSRRHWFAGRPVLITRNDYSLNLMNGDVGITLAVPLRASPAVPSPPLNVLRVAFPTPEGGVRWVLPSRLQTVETVFAMTVHKSQGSEFDHATLILPDRPSPVLTRELLYTAITRAKTRFTLVYSDEAVLGEALRRKVQRVSGLGDLCPPD
jgi:exodeoxyribonuclease V alpha subunit